MHGRGGWFFGVALAGAWTVLVFLVAPMFVVVPVSVTDRTHLAFPQAGISFQYYARLFTSDVWLRAAGQSLLVAVVSTVIVVLIGTLCAVGCWRVASRYSEMVRVFMLLPLMVPSMVHALGFYRVWVELRLLDTFTGVILVHVVTGLPYVIITVSTSLANFDARLEQAARNLGASMGQTIRLVIVPCIVPGILSGAIFAFVHSWDEIVVLLFITSRKLYLLPRALWDGINEHADPIIAAVATLLVLLTLAGLGAEQMTRWRPPRQRRAGAAEPWDERSSGPVAATSTPAP